MLTTFFFFCSVSFFSDFLQEGFDQSFIEESIFERLKDDNRDVVMSAFSALEVGVFILISQVRFLSGSEYVSGMYSF